MSHRSTRRKFLHQSSLVVGGAWAAAQTPSLLAEQKDSSVTEKSIPVVDTHQHLWDLEKFNLPWLKNGGPKALNRSFVMKDYREATADVNIAKTVYMEVNVHPSQHEKEADYVIDLCQADDNPMVAAVIGGHPHTEGFAEYAKKYAKSKYVKGVRMVLHDPDRPTGLCLKPEFVKSIQLLGELGLRFDLCMRPDELADGVKLAKQCPNTKFVLDHCGNMSVSSTDEKLRRQWQDGVKAAAQLDNMVCKISGIVVTAKDDHWTSSDLAPNMNYCMDTFGEDRAYFGGDWPVCTLRSPFARWVRALQEIVRKRSPEFQKKLFHDNAVKFYELA